WSAQGLDVLKTKEFSRKRPDGKIARWYLGGTKNGYLPILLEDITPMVDRMPLLAAGRHPNGATELLQIGLRENDTTFAGNVLKKFITSYSSSNNKNNDVINIGGVEVNFGGINMATKMSLTLSYSGGESQNLDLDKTHGVAIKMVPRT
ncbi:VOC family protein, partial [Porticoccaceae bacterium]|nr:VOC family protein [Porticoccaceae bacterium]